MNTSTHYLCVLKLSLLLYSTLFSAIVYAQKNEETDAGRATYYYREAVNYEELQENSLAMEQVSKAITLFPETDRLAKARAYVLLSRLKESQGKVSEALLDLRIAAAQAPKELEILQFLAEFQVRQQMYEDAEETCNEMRNVMPMYPAADLIAGRIEMARGQYEKALPIFDKVINRFADIARPYLDKTEALLALDRLDEAADNLMMALEINDESRQDGLKLVARMAQLPSPYLEARLNERMTVSRNNLVWLESLAYYKEGLSDFVSAQNLYRKMLETENSASVASRLSYCCLSLRQMNSALDFASKAVEWEPDSFIYKKGKARVLWYADSLSATIRQLSDCIELLPQNTFFYCKRGLLYEQMGAKDEALKDFNAVLSCQPAHTGAMLYRGRINLSRNLSLRARQDFEACVRMDTLYTANSSAPFALFYLGKRAEAETFMREILSIEGEKAYLNAVRFYSLMNENSLAISYLKRAEESNLLNYYYLMREPDLANLRTDQSFLDYIAEKQSDVLEILASEREKPFDLNSEESAKTSVVDVPVIIQQAVPKEPEVIKEDIPYEVIDGIMRVKGRIGNVKAFFAFVPGGRFQISQVKAEWLLAKKLIKRTDIQGSVSEKGIIAIGSNVFFASIQLGPVTLHNVTAVVVDRKNIAIQFGTDIFEANMLPELDHQHHVITVTIQKNK